MLYVLITIDEDNMTNKLQKINELRDAVVRRYFPSNGDPFQDTSGLYQAIDAKVLWCMQLGITAKDLESDLKKAAKEREAYLKKKKKEEEGAQDRFFKTHIHTYKRHRVGFLKYKLRCSNHRCRIYK